MLVPKRFQRVGGYSIKLRYPLNSNLSLNLNQPLKRLFNVDFNQNKKIQMIQFMNYSKQTKPKKLDDLDLIRNIGIIAHIDAGKTTTTERLLYFSGFTKRIGGVDTGDTVMDYLPQERERGITIQSACITFGWDGYKLNLIDTPGHVDFTMEVERSIRVLDGAITILDGVSGVEAQTETVFNQANRYNIPRLIFINKMDRMGSDLKKCFNEIEKKLKVKTLNLQYLVKNDLNDNIDGLIDLVNMEYLKFSKGNDNKYSMTKLLLKDIDDDTIKRKGFEMRNQLIEKVADLDDTFMDYYLNEIDDINNINLIKLKTAIRNVTLNNLACPVLIGSSLANVGIQPLLDAIVSYLPSPKDRPLPNITSSNGEIQTLPLDPKGNLCGLAFKVIYDPKRGPLTFIRIYNGTLFPRSNIFNVNTNSKERILNLLQTYADEYEDLPKLEVGNIGIALGLKHTRTGDTLVLDHKQKTLLPGLKLPSPVFVCAIEPDSLADEPHLIQSLNHLMLEDPSITITKHRDTNQLLLNGMGELHLDIVKDKLVNQFKVKATIGHPFINYKQTILEPIDEEYSYQSELVGKQVKTKLHVYIQPISEIQVNEWDQHDVIDGNVIEIDTKLHFDDIKHDQNNLTLTKPDIIIAIRDGLTSAISRGGPEGYPLTQLHIKVNQIHYYPNLTNKSALSQSVSLALNQLINKSDLLQTLEPVMLLELVISDPNQLGKILNDLTSIRNGKILSMSDQTTTTIKVKAEVPLSKLLGYSSNLRSISHGSATYSMEMAGYNPS